jgi:hypothetical protein
MTARTANAHVGAFPVAILLLAGCSGIRAGAGQACNQRGGPLPAAEAARGQAGRGRRRTPRDAGRGREHWGRAETHA